MKSKLKKVNQIINETDQPLDPRFSPQAYQDLETTGAGRVQYYPEGDRLFNWLKTKNVGFAVGYVEGASISDLQKIFQGTNVSASQVYTRSAEYQELSTTATEKSLYAANYYLDVISPAITVQLNIANSSNDLGVIIGALNEISRLNAIHDQNQQEALFYSSRADAALTSLDNYIKSGVINPKDPYQLDDPTVAAALQQKKRDKEIDKQLEQLAAENEALKSKRQWDTAKMLVGLGFDIATAISILNILSGPADEAALQAGKLSVQQILDKIAQKTGQTTLQKVGQKTGQTTLQKVGQKTGQTISGELDDIATSTVEKLLRSKGSLGDDAVRAASQIDDALASGNKNALDNALRNADDLLSGKNKTWTPKTRTSSTKTNPHYGTTGPVYQGAHRASPGPYPYIIQSYQWELTDRQIKLLKEVKQPFVVPELPSSYKMNFSGRYSAQNTTDKTSSPRSEALVASGNANGQRWKLNNRYWQGYETTERMNVIYDKVGHGDQAWERIIDEAKAKNGWRNREIQEHLNIIAHERAMIDEDPNYISPFVVVENVDVLAKEPLFKQLKKKMWQDYSKDPGSHHLKPAYPSQPPAMRGITGYHSQYGDRKDYYKRLDPHSAAAMPGGNGYDPDVDADKAFKTVMKKARIKGSNK